MSEIIVCPSGLTGEIRGLKGKEGKLLADRSAAKSGIIFDKILSSCWLSTLDSGVNSFDEPNSSKTEGTQIDWSKVLVGDRFFTLLKIRGLTFGTEFAFSIQCESPACRERFEWELDLEKLPIRTLSEEGKTKFKSGNRFETSLRNGRKIWFRLMTGADEVKAANTIKASREGPLIAGLAMRILEIEGIEPGDKRAFLEDMEMADLTALLDRFDAADCGVETSIEVECPNCLNVQEVQLPLGGNFFMPRTK